MKALSIRQPWAWLILYAGKDIENRTWRTTYRGPVLLHAAAGMTKIEYAEAVATARRAREVMGAIPGLMMPPFASLERGGIVGQFEIVDVVQSSVSPWFFGPYGFVIENAKPAPFRQMTGKLGLFETSAP